MGRRADPNSKVEFVGVRFSKSELEEVKEQSGEGWSVFIRQAALARARGGKLVRPAGVRRGDSWVAWGGEREPSDE